MSAPAPTMSSTSSGSLRPGRSGSRASFRLASVIDPIGTCHGLNSPNSPRMVTRVRQGKPQFFNSENMLMQLPTPLLCISSAARWPPSVAPAASADALLLGGQHDVMDVGVVDAQLDQPAMAGIGHVADLADADAAELRIDRVRPAAGWLVRSSTSSSSVVSCGSLRRKRRRPAPARAAAAPRMKSAAFSAIMMIGALMLAPTRSGITEPSTTRRPSTPWTRNSPSTTAIRSDCEPHLAGAERVMDGDAVGADMGVEVGIIDGIRRRARFPRSMNGAITGCRHTSRAIRRPGAQGLPVDLGREEILPDARRRQRIGGRRVRPRRGSAAAAPRRGRHSRPRRRA